MALRNRELVFAALFISLGVVIPIIFHKFGLGMAFLPMFLPLVTCGFFVSPSYALITGFITPYISSFMTGMPPLFPFAFIISLEGAAVASTASLLFNKFQKNLWISLFSALITQRIVLVLAIIALAPFFQLPENWTSIAVLTTGIPGVILQIVLVPVFVSKVRPVIS